MSRADPTPQAEWHQGGGVPYQAPGKSQKLMPLFLTLAVIFATAWIMYQVYATLVRFRDNAAERMGKNHVVWSKEGVRVGVHHIEAEKYVDRTQNFFVKAWNLGTQDGDGEKSKLKGKK